MRNSHLFRRTQVDSVVDDIVKSISDARLRMHYAGRTPIILGLATETIEGLLPVTIRSRSDEILLRANALRFEWLPEARPLRYMVADEELVVVLIRAT